MNIGYIEKYHTILNKLGYSDTVITIVVNAPIQTKINYELYYCEPNVAIAAGFIIIEYNIPYNNYLISQYVSPIPYSKIKYKKPLSVEESRLFKEIYNSSVTFQYDSKYKIRYRKIPDNTDKLKIIIYTSTRNIKPIKFTYSS